MIWIYRGILEHSPFQVDLPLVQEQAPLNGSQVALFLQVQSRVQSGPHLPAGQAGKSEQNSITDRAASSQVREIGGYRRARENAGQKNR